MKEGGKLFVDGTSLGNPGKGGAGVVLMSRKGEVLLREGRPLGWVTNNMAEYKALILGLKEAKRRGWEEIEVFSDSELMVRQINGSYRVKDEKLKGLHEEAQGLLKGFYRWSVTHIPRRENREADLLARRAARADGRSGGRWSPGGGQRKVRAPEGRMVANGDRPS